jgi:hypothetical protein
MSSGLGTRVSQLPGRVAGVGWGGTGPCRFFSDSRQTSRSSFKSRSSGLQPLSRCKGEARGGYPTVCLSEDKASDEKHHPRSFPAKPMRSSALNPMGGHRPRHHHSHHHHHHHHHHHSVSHQWTCAGGTRPCSSAPSSTPGRWSDVQRPPGSLAPHPPRSPAPPLPPPAPRVRGRLRVSQPPQSPPTVDVPRMDESPPKVGECGYYAHPGYTDLHLVIRFENDE